MSNTVENYQSLVTSEHKNKPNFLATVALSVSVYARIQAMMDLFISLFDLDQNPTGHQLDVIGEWAGVSRLINNPFSAIFFTWDGTDAQGWDFGIWQSDTLPTAIVSLPDDIYLVLIRARIAANSWDGTTEGAYAIWALLFPQYFLMIQDNQNMSFAIAIQGAVPDSLTLALLVGGYLPLKPEGVRITEYFVPVDTNPLFSWDIETDHMAGWDTGSWARELSPT